MSTTLPFGVWGSDDSSAVWRVRAGKDPSTPLVDGWDSNDGERFKVSSVRWDGKSLSFSSTMPSTSFVVGHVWTPVSAKQIRGTRSTSSNAYTLRPSDAKLLK